MNPLLILFLMGKTEPTRWEEMRIQETEAVFEEARGEMLVAFDAELRGPKKGRQ